MLADENKKSLDSRDPKDLPVMIIIRSFPEILCEERIHSRKNDNGTPVLEGGWGVTVILTSHQTAVCMFDVVFRW